MSYCICEPVETAQSLGDDTCGGNTVNGAQDHKLQNLHLSLSMGDWLAPPTGGRTRTRAEVNVRPRPLVMTKEAQPDEHEPNDQTRENHRDRAKDEDEQHERDMTFLGERPGRNKQLQ